MEAEMTVPDRHDTAAPAAADGSDLWDAAQYLRFADQRLRPFLDLLARVETVAFHDAAPRRVADLGCGPGNATALLAQRWPDAHVLGIDASPSMIEAARERRIPGRLDFELGDLRQWRSGPEGGDASGAPDPAQAPDLILANAVLQWIPAHLAVLARLAGLLPEGGALGIQVPGNFDSPSHTILTELRRSARWRDLLPPDTERPASREPVDYYDVLDNSGLTPDVWETTYLYILDGEDGVTQFVRGTAFRPILTRLSPADGAAFTAEYQTLVREVYPPREVGGRLAQVLPYRRIFATGRKL
jgi:trans-aconitate 2-methyltransferase